MPEKNPYISFYGLWEDMELYLKKTLKSLRYESHPEALKPETLNPDTEILVVFVESKVTEEVIKKLPKLRMVATMSTGYDHIDLQAAKRNKITVCNVPTYGENTVAEHTMALILGLTRKLFLSADRVKEGAYDFHGLRGVDLKGKTLGVIGTGHIGTQLITMAHGFGLKIIASDQYSNEKLAKKFGFTYVPFKKLLKQADIVSLHTPLTKKTYHLLNKKNIFSMKKGSFLINTARGALIDPQALLTALKENHLAGVGLDVMEDEDLIQNYEEIIQGKCTTRELRTSIVNTLIIEHPNTIVTPHNAFNSIEALRRIIDTTTNNIFSFIKGKPQNTIVLVQSKSLLSK